MKYTYWRSSDSETFLVEDVKIINNQSWVFYNNIVTTKQYNCLKEAFLERFTKILVQ